MRKFFLFSLFCFVIATLYQPGSSLDIARANLEAAIESQSPEAIRQAQIAFFAAGGDKELATQIADLDTIREWLSMANTEIDTSTIVEGTESVDCPYGKESGDGCIIHREFTFEGGTGTFEYLHTALFEKGYGIILRFPDFTIWRLCKTHVPLEQAINCPVHWIVQKNGQLVRGLTEYALINYDWKLR